VNRVVRIVAFLLAIFVGILAGIFYGWVANPVRYVNTTPDTLRYDYQADFVLMIAEIYQQEDNIGLAAHRLSLLGSNETPLRHVQIAIETARKLNYSSQDIDTLGKLSLAMGDWSPTPEATP